MGEDTCIETFEAAKQKLEAVERQLAKELNLSGHVRRRLIALDCAQRLVENELVVRWHELLASYNDWTRGG